MEECEYRGVAIKVIPRSQINRFGRFTLSWPGHEESVDSMYSLQKYILGEAKDFVDEWLTDGYIKLEEQASGAETRSDPRPDRGTGGITAAHSSDGC